MRYVAKYKIVEEDKEVLLRGIERMVSDDTYYARNARNDEGTGILHRGSTEFFTDLGEIIPEAKDLKISISWEQLMDFCASGRDVHWRTSTGNYEGFRIDDEGFVVYTLDGRRHGIPGWFFQFFRDRKPVEVLTYESWRTDVSPFVSGLAPESSEMKAERLAGEYAPSRRR